MFFVGPPSADALPSRHAIFGSRTYTLGALELHIAQGTDRFGQLDVLHASVSDRLRVGEIQRHLGSARRRPWRHDLGDLEHDAIDRKAWCARARAREGEQSEEAGAEAARFNKMTSSEAV